MLLRRTLAVLIAYHHGASVPINFKSFQLYKQTHPKSFTIEDSSIPPLQGGDGLQLRLVFLRVLCGLCAKSILSE
jgi:hypothetical protein